MTLSKRILSVLLAMVMVFSVVQIGVCAIDISEGEEVASTKVMLDDGTGRIVLPEATLTASPTIRVASAKNTFATGSTIVKATPSGVPEITSGYIEEAYAGELPEYPTVVFETDVSLANDKGSVSLSSNVSDLKYEVSNPTNTKWIFTITGGTIAAGNYLDFTVSFTYTYTDKLTGKTITKAYKAYASSYVDGIAQPAGFFMQISRKKPAFHSATYNRSLYRILGVNTKGSLYGGPSGTSDEGSSSWTKGYFDFVSNGFVAKGSYASAPGFNMVYHKDEDNSDGNIYMNTGLDYQRAVSTTYIDSSKGTALNGENINLRYSAFNHDDANSYHHDHDGEYKDQISSIRVQPGEIQWSDGTQNDLNASNELSFGIAPGEHVNFQDEGDYNTSSPYADIVRSVDGRQRVFGLTVPFNGATYVNSLTTQADGTRTVSYTFISVLSARYYYSTGDRCSDGHSAVNLRFQVYNKAALRGSIEEALSDTSHIPTNPLYSAPQIGITPQEWYYDNSNGCWDTYLGALRNAQRINARYDVTQGQITNAVNALDAAVAGLVVAKADFTEANALLYGDDTVTGVADLDSTNYTSESWAAVSNAQKALTQTYKDCTVFYQPFVDSLTADLQTAINNLVSEDADFTKVDEKIAYAQSKAPYDNYTDASVKTLTDLIALANSDSFRALKASQQDYIDSVAYSIEDAANALAYKDADYTEIDELIAEYNNTYLPNKDNYTTSTWNAYKGAIEEVVRGIKINQQFLVDDMADEIIAKRKKLALKPADYKAVDAAVDAADELTASDYTTASWDNLQAAIDDVDYDLLADEQATVDAYAAAINAAIGALKYAAGDYSAVYDQIEVYNGKNKDWYTAASKQNVETAINAVVYGLDKSQQAQINQYAANIQTAIAGLVLLPADYTQADAQMTRFNQVDRTIYTSGSYAQALSAYNTLSQNHSLTIDKQSTVDTYANNLKTAIDNLQKKPASYTAVNTAINNANALLAAADTYAANNNNNPYYTAASRANLESAVSNVVTGLFIDEQATVDGYAAAINSAIAALKCNTADYTAVNTAIANVPADLDSGRYVAAKVAAVKNALNAVVEGLLTEEQETVNGYADAINTAVSQLALNGADYTAVEAAIASKPADLTPYTAASVQNLNDKINAVVYGLTIDDQATVDGYAAAINAAVQALKLDKADYTAVETAKTAAADALAAADAQYYTDASKQAVTDAVNAVVYDLLKAQQTTVDGYAAAINAAVADLAYKPINRAAFDEAVAAFNAVENIENYTAASVAACTDKIAEGNALLAGDVNVKDQASLDAITAALNAAIAALALNGADYTAVNAAIAEANDLAAKKDLYVDFTGVEAAVAAVQTGLTVDKQTTVDGFATAINAAIAALQFKPIDTTAYVAAKGTIPADLTIYTDASVAAVNDQIDAIDTFLAGDVDINDQAALDSMVATLNNKINALALKNADYTALNAVIDEFLDVDETLYSNYEDAYDVYYAVKSWKSKNGNLKIDKQALIDEQTALLRAAIDSLLPIAPPEPAEYFQAKEGSTTVIKDGKIYGLKTSLTEKQMKENFIDTNVEDVTYTKAVKSAKFLGTGSTVTVKYKDGTVEEYVIIIYGDLDGNGLINYADVSLINLAVAESDTLDANQTFAADIDGRRRVTASDAANLNVAAQGSGLNQVKPSLPVEE